MSAPLIIAHRGAPGPRRENTLRGFLEGIARGAEWLELDLHRTADGALAVVHNFRLGGKPVPACTLAEARARARRLRGIVLPTLEEVLEGLPETIGLNLEIKAPGIGADVVRVVAKHRAAARVLCTSFHLPTVRDLARLRPRLRTGLLTRTRLRHPVDEVRRARAGALFPHHALVDAVLVEELHRAGLGVYVWTVNRTAHLKRMLALGVEGIITDDPQRLACLRRHWRPAEQSTLSGNSGGAMLGRSSD